MVLPPAESRRPSLASSPGPAALALGACLLAACNGRALVGRVAPDGGTTPDDAGAAADTADGAAFTDYVDPSAPPRVQDAFGGPASPDAAARPRLVYPLDGAVLPRNLRGMNLQWSAGSENTIFRLRITADDGTPGVWRVFAGDTACPDGRCQVPVPDAFWGAVSAGLAGRAATVVVDGTPITGGPIATSAAVTLRFTADPLPGDVYFFSAPGPGYSGGSIRRASLADPTAATFLSASSRPAAGRCVGCHEVSRDGCKVSANHFDSNAISPTNLVPPRTVLVVPAKDPERNLVTEPAGFAHQSFSPDGKRLIGVLRGELSVRDETGRLVTSIPRALVGPPGQDVATHPEWSPDGTAVVFTRLAAGSQVVDDNFHSGDIMIMPVNGGAFGSAQVLVPSTTDELHYYPTFSPDSRWVVFVTGRKPGKAPHQGRTVPSTNLSPYDQQTSRLRLVTASGGLPVELANATHGQDVASTWPRFAPFTIEGRSFLVFASKIDYGFVIEQAPIVSADGRYLGRPQLWAAAIELGRPGDPSFAPFWLPFQPIELRNNRGVWTARTVAELQCP